jgi:hypothetical protein
VLNLLLTYVLSFSTYRCAEPAPTGTDLIQIKTRSVFLFVSPQAEHFIFCEAKYFTFAREHFIRRKAYFTLEFIASSDKFQFSPTYACQALGYLL